MADSFDLIDFPGRVEIAGRLLAVSRDPVIARYFIMAICDCFANESMSAPSIAQTLNDVLAEFAQLCSPDVINKLHRFFPQLVYPLINDGQIYNAVFVEMCQAGTWPDSDEPGATIIPLH